LVTFQRVTTALDVTPIFLARSEFAKPLAEDSREKADYQG
jgi:hypothetical protein